MFSLKPGKDGNVFDCPKPCPPRKQIIFKTCPRDPYIQDTSCRPNTSISAMLIKTKFFDECGKPECGFIIETFDGDCVVPINFECFCINLTGDDRELISVLFEDVSDHYCSSLGRPVRVLKVSRLWTGEIRTARGTVRRVTDSNGNIYHQIVDDREFDEAAVYLIPIHTMGVTDDCAFMTSLEGDEVSITYVDFGKERPERCGIPITIIDLEQIQAAV